MRDGNNLQDRLGFPSHDLRKLRSYCLIYKQSNIRDRFGSRDTSPIVWKMKCPRHALWEPTRSSEETGSPNREPLSCRPSPLGELSFNDWGHGDINPIDCFGDPVRPLVSKQGHNCQHKWIGSRAYVAPAVGVYSSCYTHCMDSDGEF